MSIAPAMFSSTKQDWATPQAFFEQLAGEFAFDLDAAASAENTKCPAYFDAERNGLLQDWYGTVWCNPPYGRGIGEWVAKARAETARGVTTVMLLPARTDTRWFWAHCQFPAEVRFVKGRLRFGGAAASAPFPSMLVIFRPAGVLQNAAQT